MGLLGGVRTWLSNLARGGGGKRLPRYATQTADGSQILIDSSETVFGNTEAAEFFRDVCGGSLKDIMLRAGLTNVPAAGGEILAAPLLPHVARAQQMHLFKKLGVRVTASSEVPVYAKPGTYPYVEIGRSNVAEDAPANDHQPLRIDSAVTDQSRPMHATVVFTVLDVRRESRQKQVTVHFHGRGIVRAKGFIREVGAMGRPTHYDGQEIRELINQRARQWAAKIYWCSTLERY